MNTFRWLPVLGLTGVLMITSSVFGQQTPYIGFVYPAGGERGTTFQIRLGGQRIDDVRGAVVSGEGVHAKVVQCLRKMSNQEMTILREQLRELRAASRVAGKNVAKGAKRGRQPAPVADKATREMIARIEYRIANWVNQPACAAISSLVMLEVTVDPDATPGRREIRLVTYRGVSNPMVFHVGQLPEFAREPMKTCVVQVLGKEGLALRKRPEEEVEQQVTIPCTANGQIASGEVNRYRFLASKGQQLVISVRARELIPYVADAVPGWFQPVLSLCDANGREVAYNDDFRFKPDPTLFYQVPRDGEYVLSITDAIFRGREDFVYRVSISELPFVTSVFPLGARVGESVTIEMNGWNLDGAHVTPPAKDAAAGIHSLVATRDGVVSNSVPFALDTLPECLDKEPNPDTQQAQQVTLPIIVNGRVDRPDDWDVFQIDGKAGESIVAEVHARRLDSPLDSVVRITDKKGKLLGLNDDNEDAGSGVNTHHADSYLLVTLPADGPYFIHLGDTNRNGGTEYAYRLRISHPQPDFALRVVPSALSIRSRSSANVTVHAIRRDGFTGNIRIALKDPLDGFTAKPITLAADKDTVRLSVRTTLRETEEPVHLTFEGTATIDGKNVSHQAVPAEDRMQAFLWRHLVPAQSLDALVYNASSQPPLQRVRDPSAVKKNIAPPTTPPKFTKRQVAGRLRQLALLYGEWLLTDEFYDMKVAECEAVQ